MTPVFRRACGLALAGLLLAAPASAQNDKDVSQIDDAKLIERANQLFDPIPTEPPELKDNKVTPERVELGRMLFFDPRLSASHAISCNSCHQMGLGGDDNQPTSIGHGWQRGPRNAPTVFNAVFNSAQFWDGRAEDLAQQAKGPVQASVEMANTPDRAVKTLKSMPEYVDRSSRLRGRRRPGQLRQHGKGAGGLPGDAADPELALRSLPEGP